jgi:hypothetical protein
VFFSSGHRWEGAGCGCAQAFTEENSIERAGCNGAAGDNGARCDEAEWEGTLRRFLFVARL